MDVKALQWELAAFVAERGLDPLHNPKNLAMALAAEAGRLLDLFKWLTEEQSRRTDDVEQRAAAADATADIVVHALRLADELGIDLEDAVRRRMAKHAEAHPVPAAEPEPPAPVARAEEKPAPREEKRERPPRTPPSAAPAIPGPVTQTPRQAATPQRESARAQREGPPSRMPTPPAAARPASRQEPRREAPKPAPPPPPVQPEVIKIEPVVEEERYVDLDTEAIAEFLKSLSRRVDGTHSDHPMIRELQDELTTLRRTLYAKTIKRAWLGTSLTNLRTMLEQSVYESIGEEIRAKDHIAQIDRILGN